MSGSTEYVEIVWYVDYLVHAARVPVPSCCWYVKDVPHARVYQVSILCRVRKWLRLWASASAGIP